MIDGLVSKREQCFKLVANFESFDHVLEKNFEYSIFGKRVWIKSDILFIEYLLKFLCKLVLIKRVIIMVSELRVEPVLQTKLYVHSTTTIAHYKYDFG